MKLLILNLLIQNLVFAQFSTPKIIAGSAFGAYKIFKHYSESKRDCGVTQDQSFIQEVDDKEYEQYSPHYTQVCFSGAESRKDLRGNFLQKIIEKIKGRSLVHGFSYVHGLCRVSGGSLPQVKLCDENSDHEGVGVTTNLSLHNAAVNFVPGKKYLFPDSDEKYTKQFRDKVGKELVEKGFFDDIDMKEKGLPRYSSGPNRGKPMPISEPDTKNILAKFASGWDYNINKERPSYCVRIPLDKKELIKVRDFYNNLNQSTTDEGGLKFSFRDYNCSHPHINMLADLGLMKHICTSSCAPKCKNKPNARGNFSIPSAIPLDALQVMNDQPIDLESVFKDEEMKKKIYKKYILPFRPGVLLDYYPIKGENDLFNPLSTFMANTIFHNSTSKKGLGATLNLQTDDPYQKYLKVGRYAKLESNLRYHLQNVETVIKEIRKNLQKYSKVKVNGISKYQFAHKYLQLLLKSKKQITKKLKRF